MVRPVVAIVGRPNVGKSTLFNRLVGGLVAIVEDTPGVTRDRLYRSAEWNAQKFVVIDTGGIVPNPGENVIWAQTKRQAEIAIEEADLLLLVVDARTGITSEDEVLADMLRRTQKPVLVVANKVDNFNQPPSYYEFLALGLGEPIPVSASLGLNIGDLLDDIVERLPVQDEEEIDQDTIRIAVIGRPNVGKSSLVNAILGEERVIVSEIPGTTRDAIDTPFERDGQKYILIDTAGLRRKSRVVEGAERYSVIRALRAIDRCDVALMLIDATQAVTEQDKRIAGYAHEAGKAIVLIINKWDLVVKDERTMNQYDKAVREALLFLQYAPTLYISARTHQRVAKVLDLVNFVAEQHAHRVATSVLNEVLNEATQMNPPPGDKGRRLRILYGTQVQVKPPTFVLFVNEPDLFHFSYRRYLENQIRKSFGFEGSPLRIIVRRREDRT
ncbi:MAG: ribosome biogenesis GTPase Der [Syntrophomonadaceae bacterium]|nr:ribosome biogenesis GTPase Der [Syntrophomonadaceae bacterium]